MMVSRIRPAEKFRLRVVNESLEIRLLSIEPWIDKIFGPYGCCFTPPVIILIVTLVGKLEGMKDFVSEGSDQNVRTV
jgi:hypothetical protein